jgi:hypothetical protein
MPALFLLLAIIGAAVVGDLVLENPSGGAVTVFHHTIAGATQGQLLAVAAALGAALPCWWPPACARRALVVPGGHSRARPGAARRAGEPDSEARA